MNTETNTRRFLTTAQAAEFLKRKPQTLRIWRMRGGGPRYIRMGNNVQAPVMYRLSELEKWLENRDYGSTSEETAL